MALQGPIYLCRIRCFLRIGLECWIHCVVLMRPWSGLQGERGGAGMARCGMEPKYSTSSATQPSVLSEYTKHVARGSRRDKFEMSGDGMRYPPWQYLCLSGRIGDLPALSTGKDDEYKI